MVVVVVAVAVAVAVAVVVAVAVAVAVAVVVVVVVIVAESYGAWGTEASALFSKLAAGSRCRTKPGKEQQRQFSNLFDKAVWNGGGARTASTVIELCGTLKVRNCLLQMDTCITPLT
ncbi:hypothetical protein EMCRGX_G027536 [Ephydatia muelleri]